MTVHHCFCSILAALYLTSTLGHLSSEALSLAICAEAWHAFEEIWDEDSHSSEVILS